MKKTTLLISTLSLSFLVACSNSTAHLTPECQKVNNELSQLKSEKYESLTAQLTTKLQVNEYPFHDKEKLDEKIKVLKMKFQECQRE
jgi:hypothetical protein